MLSKLQALDENQRGRLGVKIEGILRRRLLAWWHHFVIAATPTCRYIEFADALLAVTHFVRRLLHSCSGDLIQRADVLA